ncbi:MAG: GFA family protein [Pseudomonadota bacterium]
MTNEPSSKRFGKCLCGAVAFSVDIQVHDDGVHIDACHCNMCRRQIGGPLLGITLAGPPNIDDAETLAVYPSSDWAERLFCKNCGSNLFYRFKNGAMHTVHAGALDDLSDGKLVVEIFTDEKPSYYDFNQPTQALTGQQVMALFADGAAASSSTATQAD